MSFWKEFKKAMVWPFGKELFKDRTPKIPPPPVPSPPPEQITDQASDEIRRRQRSRVSGRRRTIVTGDLSPVNPQKTTLLGRTSPR